MGLKKGNVNPRTSRVGAQARWEEDHLCPSCSTLQDRCLLMKSLW